MTVSRLAATVAAVFALAATDVHAKGPPGKRIAVTATPISAVQGDGITASAAGSTVTVEGIVTARTADGFFVQSGDGETDGNPATSEGLFVFLGGAPGSNAGIGHRVQLTGPIEEYTPAANPHQMPLTRMAIPTAHVVLATGQALPAPIVLTHADLAAGMDVAALERLEGMRVALPVMTVVGPTGAVLDETLRTAAPTGVLHAIAKPENLYTDRPFREPGIPLLDANPIPAGKSPPIFDGNPQVLRFDSTGQPGAPLLNLGSPDEISGAVGVLSYAEAAYTLLPDPGAALVTTARYRGEGSGGSAPDQFRMMWLDLGRLFDPSDDPARAEPVPSAALYQARLEKVAKSLCDFLANPDVIAVSGAESRRVLQDLADVVDSNPSGYCSAAPDYQPVFMEGRAADGLDVGLLVSGRIVDGLNPRVEVLGSAQLFSAALSAHPAGSNEFLFQRPPLMARLRVTHPRGGQAELTVVATQLQDMAGIADMTPGGNGWTTAGQRIMALRARQAETLATWVEAFQQADPEAALALLGGFESLPFNDGRVDTLGVLMGQPAPAEQTLLAVTSPVTLPLTNVMSLEFEGLRFKSIRDGHAEAVDHILVNEAARRQFSLEWRRPRLNAQYPATLAVDTTSRHRLSDRDPVMVALAPGTFSDAETELHFAGTSPASTVSDKTVYFIAINNGPDLARGVEIRLRSSLAPSDYAVTLDPPTEDWPGWTCDPLQADGTGSMTTCRINGAGLVATDDESIPLTIPANDALAGTTQTFSAELLGRHRDPDGGNNTASGSILFEDRTNLRIVANKAAVEDALPGQPFRLIATLTNQSINPPGDIAVELTVDSAVAETTLTSTNTLASCDAGVDIAPRRSRWNCVVPSGVLGQQHTAFLVDISTRLDDGSRVFTLTAKATPSRTEMTPADNEASVSHEVPDKFDLYVSGTDQELADLDDPLYLSFFVQSLRIGVGRNATGEILIDAPLSAVGPVTVTPGYTTVNWTCSAPEAVNANQTRVRCSAPAILEQPNHVSRNWLFRTTVTPPFRAGLAEYPIAASMVLAMDSEDVSPSDNQAQSVATINQTTDLGVSVQAEASPVYEPARARYALSLSRGGRNLPRNARARLEVDAVFAHAGLVVTDEFGNALACAATSAPTGRTAVLCPLAYQNGLRLSVPTGPDLANRTLTLRAAVDNDLIDVTPANNSASAGVQVLARADLCVEGRCPGTQPAQRKVIAGDTIEVVHLLRNLGPSTARATTLTFEATLPPARMAASVDQGSCTVAVALNPTTSRVTCALGDRIGQANQAVALSLRFDAAELAGGTIPYSIALASPTPDPVPANNRLDHSVLVVPNVDLSVAMRARGRAYPGQQHFLLDLRADGPQTAALSSLVVNVNAPGGAGYGDIEAPGWSCNLVDLGIPGRYEYRCQRYVAMTPGVSHPVTLKVDADAFLQIGSVIRVTAAHTFSDSQPAGDRNSANNAASALQGVDGRRTQSVRGKPTPAYGDGQRTPPAAPGRGPRNYDPAR